MAALMKRFLALLFLSAACACAQTEAGEYRIAVVGLVHSHVWGHLNRMVEGQPARLVGVAETVPELIAEAKKRGVAENLFYADYRRMLDETKPQIVWAFVENNRHLEVAREAAARKIHILFEKPLASTLKDALAIRDLAQRSGIQVMTNYQMAWWPTLYAAKAQAESGAIGKVWRLRGVVGHGGPGSPTGLNKWFFNWLTDPVQNGGGALVDFGCYNALWSLWYMGRPQSVYATVSHLQPERFPKVEDSATLVLNYPNGVGLFEASWDLPRSFQDLEVFGNKGSVYMTNNTVEVRKGRESAQPVQPGLLEGAQAEPIAFFIEAIRSGRPISGLTGLDMNVEVVEILEAARESVRTGRAVRLASR